MPVIDTTTKHTRLPIIPHPHHDLYFDVFFMSAEAEIVTFYLQVTSGTDP